MMRMLIPFIAALIAAIAVGIINPSAPIPHQAAVAQTTK
jgi:hypothetical protein